MGVKLDYSITVDEFLEMVESVGWKSYTREQIEKALQNLNRRALWKSAIWSRF